ncbi:MAG: MaoC family dehydratase [Pseudomonadota bacterium]
MFDDRALRPVTLTNIVRYQGASGDFHPAHHDPEYARAHRYPSVFSLALLSAGEMLSIVSEWFGAENLRGFSSRFRATIWLGDVLVFSSKVAEIEELDSTSHATLELLCSTRDRVVIEATATFVIETS